MKKITLQLKTVSNPKQKEKNSVGAAYLNLLKQQASHIKVFKPDMISKMSPQKSESSPKHFTIIPPKTDKKLFKNQKENIKGFNEENKTAKSTKNPTVHTLNLNLQVEKPQFLKENGSSSRQSENPLETTITSTKNIEDSQKILRILKFNCLNHTKKKAKYFKLSEDTVSSEENIEKKYYCSKCAIDMALNGIRVYDILNPNNTELINSSRKAEIKSLMKNILLSTEKTESNEEEEIKLKKVEIESFIAELETVQNSGVHSMSLLQGKKIEINNFYEKQSLKNEENFQNIFESLELCKKNICEKIKSSKEENEFLINNYHNQISNSLKDMNYIHSDISQNFESIIKNMDRKPFTIILNKYYQKLKSFEMIYQNLNKERIILNPSQLSLKNLPGKQFKLNEEICKLINPVFGKILSDSTSKKNENNVYISFDDKDAFEKSPASLDKHLIKTEKNTPNKCLYANISEKENLNSPNTEKYLKLLQKVNNNQENTNIFYNDHIKSQQLKSSESCKILKMSGEKKNDEKNFHKFFSKIEKNLDKNEIKINNAYQKHLFCSPHFKENSDLII